MTDKTKIEQSHRALKIASEMSQHYYEKPLIVCYSGGKDSDTILRLAMECLEPNDFEVMYSVTTVDSFVTTTHINEVFKELEGKGIKTIRHIPLGKDGKPTNMWKLIVEKEIPPTRTQRYCCQVLKETSTPNRMAVLGVRGGESKKRQGRDTFQIKGNTLANAKFFSLDHSEEVYQEALKHENEENGSVWDCTMIATMKAHEDMIVNPIYEWSDTDVWEYLKENNYKYNPMYDMGYTRCGCIGCPLAGYRIRTKEFSDFPYAKELYIKAFDEMLKVRKAKGKGKDKGSWTSGQAVFDWWVEEWKQKCKGQISIEEYLNDLQTIP